MIGKNVQHDYDMKLIKIMEDVYPKLYEKLMNIVNTSPNSEESLRAVLIENKEKIDSIRFSMLMESLLIRK